MASPYGTRTLVSVVPFTGSTIKYGFYTNADGGTQSALGHTAITGAYPPGFVLGANAPKPPKAFRMRASGSESSFCSADAVAAAKAAGWKVQPGRLRLGASSTRSKTVYVTVDGNKIAWKMPQYSYSRITAGDRTALGIRDATSADLDLVFGVRFPKLPRVKFLAIPTTGAASSQSTFCDPDAIDNLPAGWVAVRVSKEAL
jgi:hypothetical protein